MPHGQIPPEESLQDFGPVKPQMTDRSEDHEHGWHEKKHTAEGGGHVPEFHPDREVPRTPIAQRFAERIKQAQSNSPEGA